MCKTGYHSIALTMKNAMKVVACRSINYNGHNCTKTQLTLARTWAVGERGGEGVVATRSFSELHATFLTIEI